MTLSRRQFVQGVGMAGLALLAGCGRLPGQVQAPPKVPRIGGLWSGGVDTRETPPPGVSPAVDGFVQGLRDLGYVDGQNVVVEWRESDRGEPRLRELADELVRRPVDVLIGDMGTTQIARQVTDTVPLVFVGCCDPVAAGLVASLARPGGNVTGFTVSVGDTQSGKLLELLKEAAPSVSRVGILHDASLPLPGVTTTGGMAATAAEALGLHRQSIGVRSADDLPGAFDVASRDRVDGLLVPQTPLIGRNEGLIADLALKHHLPSIGIFRGYAGAGGLLAYGPDLYALHRRAATYVDKILKGAKPGDLPIEQPREFTFAINLKTAQALGLTIPQHVLLQATEVVQ